MSENVLHKTGYSPTGVTYLRNLFCWFEAVIHSGEAAVRLIAGHIEKFAFLTAGRADFRRFNFHNGVSAVAAFPSIFGKGYNIFGHDPLLLSDFIKFITQSASYANGFCPSNKLEINGNFL
jgi:hypothetical protein